jgi:hypothetical protein
VAGQGGIDEKLVNQHHRHNNNTGRRQQGNEVRKGITALQLLDKLPRAPG